MRNSGPAFNNSLIPWRYEASNPESRDSGSGASAPSRMTTSVVLFLLRLLAADRFQLGEHGVDVEVVALLFGRLEFRLLAGGLGSRQQRGAAVGGVGRLLLGGALHLEIELDLRAQAERHRVHRGQGRGVPVGAVAH